MPLLLLLRNILSHLFPTPLQSTFWFKSLSCSLEMIDVLCEFKIMLNFGGGCGGQWIRLLSWPILVRILSRQCSFYHKGNLEASRFDFAKKLSSLLGEKSMIWTFFLDLHYFSLLLHCNVRNLFNHYYKRSTIVIYDSTKSLIA